MLIRYNDLDTEDKKWIRDVVRLAKLRLSFPLHEVNPYVIVPSKLPYIGRKPLFTIEHYYKALDDMLTVRKN